MKLETIVFNSIFMNKRKLFVFGLLGLAFLALIGTSVLAFMLLSRTNTGLSAAEQLAILRRIALNNPSYSQLATAGSAAENALAAAPLGTSLSSDRMMIAPGWIANPDANYFYSKTSITRGPAFEQCTYGINLQDDIFIPVVESYNFFDESNYYSKYVGYNQDGSINNYSLSTSENNGVTYRSENYTYLGGSYAVRNVYEYPVDSQGQLRAGQTSVSPVAVDTGVTDVVDPVSIPVSAPEEIEPTPETPTEEVPPIDPTEYFGPDVQIIGMQNINGRDYYIIQHSYQADCAGYQNKSRWEFDIQQDIRTIYSVSYADAENYQIARVDNYLDYVGNDRLMESSTTETVNEKRTVAELSISFNFDLNVPVRDIVINTTSPDVLIYDPESELQKQVDYARNTNIDVLLPNATDATNQSLYISNYDFSTVDNSSNYYADRAFYPLGELGDKMFAMYNGSFLFTSPYYYPTTVGTVSYTLGTSNYSINIYNNQEDNIKIVDSFLWSELRNKMETQVSVSINGEVVSGTLYSYEYSQGGTIMPLAAESQARDDVATSLIAPAPDVPINLCGQDECWYTDYILVFEFGNNKYALKEYSNTGMVDSITYDLAADNAEFSAYNTSNSSDFQVIETLLRDSLKPVASSSGEGSMPDDRL